MQLGEILVAQGAIAPEQLKQGLMAQKQLGGRLGSILVEFGFLSEQELAEALSRQLGVPFVTADEIAQVPAEVIARVPQELAAKYRVVPVRAERKDVWVAFTDPRDLHAVDAIGFAIGAHVHGMVATEISLKYALHRYYGIGALTRSIRLSKHPNVTLDVVTVSGRDDRSHFLDPAAHSDFRRDTETQVDPVTITAPVIPAPQTPNLAALAAAESETTVLETTASFLHRYFAQMVFMRTDGSFSVGILGHGLSVNQQNVTKLALHVEQGSPFFDASYRSKIVFREVMVDPLVGAVCSSCAINNNKITLLPIQCGGAPRYVVIAQGLARDSLAANSESIIDFLRRASMSLQITVLKRRILEPAREAE